nr:hypothetical protein 16 [Desulfobulbaceae bacterium]
MKKLLIILLALVAVGFLVSSATAGKKNDGPPELKGHKMLICHNDGGDFWNLNSVAASSWCGCEMVETYEGSGEYVEVCDGHAYHEDDCVVDDGGNDDAGDYCEEELRECDYLEIDYEAARCDVEEL